MVGQGPLVSYLVCPYLKYFSVNIFAILSTRYIRDVHARHGQPLGHRLLVHRVEAALPVVNLGVIAEIFFHF